MGEGVLHDGRVSGSAFLTPFGDVSSLDSGRRECKFGGKGSVGGGEGHVEQSPRSFVQEAVDLVCSVFSVGVEFESVPGNGAGD